MTELPDIAKSLQKIKIMLDLETKTDYNTILGHSILTAIYFKKPPDEVIDFIKSQIKQNTNAVISVIGEELTESIINF